MAGQGTWLCFLITSNKNITMSGDKILQKANMHFWIENAGNWGWGEVHAVTFKDGHMWTDGKKHKSVILKTSRHEESSVYENESIKLDIKEHVIHG